MEGRSVAAKENVPTSTNAIRTKRTLFISFIPVRSSLPQCDGKSAIFSNGDKNFSRKPLTEVAQQASRSSDYP
jgi:hypothetical protein